MNLVIMRSPCHENLKYASPCCTPGGSRMRCRPWCRGYTRAPPPWPPATGWPEPPARRRGCRQSSRCWPLHLCFRWGHCKHYLSLLFNSFIFHSLLIWRCYEKLLYDAIFECASWRIYLILFQDRMLPSPIDINCIGNIQQVSCLLKFSGLILILILEGKATPSLGQWRPWV